MINNIRLNFSLVLCVFCYLTTQAQKLPNVQLASVRAPADIKIDGKATEWNYPFQAYNRATDVFYTLSNDDDNLYLTLQATDEDIIRKIINGRISFTINKSGKKSEQDAVVITYPLIGRISQLLIYGKNQRSYPAQKNH